LSGGDSGDSDVLLVVLVGVGGVGGCWWVVVGGGGVMRVRCGWCVLAAFCACHAQTHE
jgi:hypothetical protein